MDMVGKYRVIRQIGQGGMGAVYEAFDDKIKNRIAIKVLKTDHAANVQVVMRFINEAQIANSVCHPGIVKVFDHGYLPTGEAYLVMEFVAGESMRERLRQGCSEEQVVRWGRQIASILAAVHEVGVVHRDLKPDNLMLTGDPDVPGGERIRILDFGIARITRPEEFGDPVQMTATGMLIGTPSYMAPEQCGNAKSSDAKSDAYALGVIFYEMLCGAPPFASRAQIAPDGPPLQGGGIVEILYQHLHASPPSIQAQRPDISPRLAELIHRLLAKSPSVRPSMQELVAELEILSALVTNKSHRKAKQLALPIRTPLSGMEQYIPRIIHRHPLGKTIACICAGFLSLFILVSVGWRDHFRPTAHYPSDLALPSIVNNESLKEDDHKASVGHAVSVSEHGNERSGQSSIIATAGPRNKSSQIISERTEAGRSARKVPRSLLVTRNDAIKMFEAAEAAYNKDEYSQAIKLLLPIVTLAGILSFESNQRGWMLIGRSACRTKNIVDAEKAFLSLGGNQSEYARAAVLGDCRKNELKCESAERTEFCAHLSTVRNPVAQQGIPGELRDPFRTAPSIRNP